LRIDITSFETNPEAVNIDFEYGAILVNLTLEKKDLENLQKLIAETLKYWTIATPFPNECVQKEKERKE